MNELRFATVDEALQHLAELENTKIVIAMPTIAPVKPKPGTKPDVKPGQPSKQPRTIPMPQPKNRGMNKYQPGKKSFASTELRFATTDEAFQHLANITENKIKIADKDQQKMVALNETARDFRQTIMKFVQAVMDDGSPGNVVELAGEHEVKKVLKEVCSEAADMI